MDKERRNFLKTIALSPLLMNSSILSSGKNNHSNPQSGPKFSVNAYSFNQQLKSGEMTFYDMMDFAASIGLDAVDLTGYYFNGYPQVPHDSELFALKRKALSLGLNISWTGIRNDFVNPNAEARAADVNLINNWLGVSSKLGASIMRIFTGKSKHGGYSREEVKTWMVEEFKTCAAAAKDFGVIAGMQNHNNFLHRSDEIIEMLKRVESEWFGLILDIGSLPAADPYAEIKRLAPYANYWFVKENVQPNGNPEKVNMRRIAEIVRQHGYLGYISFENLSKGNPEDVVARMADSFRNEYEKI